jgi:hypothetical protein
MSSLNRIVLVLSGLLSAWSFVASAAQQDQATMDAACQAARQEQLAPLREQSLQQCLTQGEKDQATCEAEAANYGERVGIRQAMFYDLPECESAFNNKRSYRSAN